MIIFVLIFYFLIYRPQKKQQAQRETMLSALKKGDKVLTVGGIYGTIVGFSGDVITLKIAEKVEIEVNRTAIGGVGGPGKTAETK